MIEHLDMMRSGFFLCADEHIRSYPSLSIDSKEIVMIDKHWEIVSAVNILVSDCTHKSDVSLLNYTQVI